MQLRNVLKVGNSSFILKNTALNDINHTVLDTVPRQLRHLRHDAQQLAQAPGLFPLPSVSVEAIVYDPTNDLKDHKNMPLMRFYIIKKNKRYFSAVRRLEPEWDAAHCLILIDDNSKDLAPGICHTLDVNKVKVINSHGASTYQLASDRIPVEVTFVETIEGDERRPVMIHGYAVAERRRSRIEYCEGVSHIEGGVMIRGDVEHWRASIMSGSMVKMTISASLLPQFEADKRIKIRRLCTRPVPSITLAAQASPA